MGVLTRGGTLGLGAVSLAVLLAVGPARAQAPTGPPPAEPPPTAPAAPASSSPAGPNTGRTSLSAGIDVPTDDSFRGIAQDTEDYILRPYRELTFKLVERAGPMSNLGLTLGLWNSHGGPTGVEGGAGGVERSRNGRFGTVQELALSLGHNDAGLLGPSR